MSETRICQTCGEGALARQALVNRELEAERHEHGELDATPLATRLHAKRRAQLEQERADVERREQEAIDRERAVRKLLADEELQVLWRHEIP
jgi:hypothetical protein